MPPVAHTSKQSRSQHSSEFEGRNHYSPLGGAMIRPHVYPHFLAAPMYSLAPDLFADM